MTCGVLHDDVWGQKPYQQLCVHVCSQFKVPRQLCPPYSKHIGLFKDTNSNAFVSMNGFQI